jgi:MFS family permease
MESIGPARLINFDMPAARKSSRINRKEDNLFSMAGTAASGAGGAEKKDKVAYSRVGRDERYARREKLVVPGSQEETTKKNLGNSVIEGAFGNADASIRNNYTTPFALALGATHAQIGILTSLHNLATTVSQIPGAGIADKLGSRKRVWFFSNIMQKFFWLPIILLPFLDLGDRILALILLVAFGAFFANIRGPAWSSLMADIVPRDRWGKYFGWRSAVMSAAGLIAMLIGGQLLVMYGFPAIFALGMGLGVVSIFYFARIKEPHFRGNYHYHHQHISLNPRGWLNGIKVNRNFAVFTLFMTSMSFAVNIAVPFFTVYMLEDLDLGYMWYSFLVVWETLVMIVFQRYWGGLCDKFGDRNIMAVTGFMVCFVPFLWLFITSPYQIMAADAFSAFAWAGFNVATFNFMLAAAPADRRAKFTANYTFFTGLGVVGGAIVGGVLATIFSGSVVMWMTGLQVVFLVSFVARLASMLFITTIREMRVSGAREPITEIFWSSVVMNPSRRMAHAVIYLHHVEWGKELRYVYEEIKSATYYRLRLFTSDK